MRVVEVAALGRVLEAQEEQAVEGPVVAVHQIRQMVLMELLTPEAVAAEVGLATVAQAALALSS